MPRYNVQAHRRYLYMPGNDLHAPGSHSDAPRSYACQNATQLWPTWFFHAAHAGNVYLRIERGAGMEPFALHNLLPETVVSFRVEVAGQIR